MELTQNYLNCSTKQVGVMVIKLKFLTIFVNFRRARIKREFLDFLARHAKFDEPLNISITFTLNSTHLIMP